jgi:hypothetical protein
MDAIEAVVALARERDELEADLETYESWFESLVGKHVILTVKHKKQQTKFVECLVTEFVEGEGWELQAIEDDEVHVVTFEDFVEGRVYVRDDK